MGPDHKGHTSKIMDANLNSTTVKIDRSKQRTKRSSCLAMLSQENHSWNGWSGRAQIRQIYQARSGQWRSCGQYPQPNHKLKAAMMEASFQWVRVYSRSVGEKESLRFTDDQYMGWSSPNSRQLCQASHLHSHTQDHTRVFRWHRYTSNSYIQYQSLSSFCSCGIIKLRHPRVSQSRRPPSRFSPPLCSFSPSHQSP